MFLYSIFIYSLVIYNFLQLCLQQLISYITFYVFLNFLFTFFKLINSVKLYFALFSEMKTESIELCLLLIKFHILPVIDKSPLGYNLVKTRNQVPCDMKLAHQ